MSLVLARDLTKTHDHGGVQTTALDALSIEIARGEFVAVVGPSGCGKTTLLNLLGGLDRPTSRRALPRRPAVQTAPRRSWARLRRRSVGFVFQFFNLVPNLTVADNVELRACWPACPGASAARARRAADRARPAGRAARLPGRLSGGEQQRVALARALINRPTCCWPTSRRATSTAAPRATSCASCAASTTRARRSSWSPTTRRSPARPTV